MPAYDTVAKRYLYSPCVAVLHRKMTEPQPYIHSGLHLQLPYQEIHLCMLAQIQRWK